MQKDSEMEKIASENQHDKWIVVTTVSSPTEDIKKLAETKGWKVVVVGDQKTPMNWTFPGCIFLDVRKHLPYSISHHLPHNSYTRKNIGYLYAIQHGARFIYDTDDDNHPTSGSLNFNENPEMTGLIYDNVDGDNNVMNPYAHFGQQTIWPRGYPLDAINIPNSDTYRLTSIKTPAIQQGLVNGDPDVDAIFRLTRKLDKTHPINITFDSRAPPFILPEGIFAPFNSQNTFFTYDSLWALYLPSSVAFRVTDIWRGYWAQRLLWLLGHKLAFFPPNAVQLRNAHNYLSDFQDENQFYVQTDSFITFLTSWTCDDTTFFKCVSQLSHDMANNGFWKNSDAVTVDAWLYDLTIIGYKEPLCETTTKVPEDCRVASILSQIKHSTNAQDKATFNNRVYFSANRDNQFKTSNVQQLKAFCENVDIVVIKNASMLYSSPKFLFEDKLLVIVFNFPYYANIRILDALYHDHFPNIVYCGQTKSRESLHSDIQRGLFIGNGRQLSFINITSSQGFFGYECAIRAMQMNYNVNGYLILGDDVMLNLWNFHHLEPEMARLSTSSGTMNRYLAPNQTGWIWWKSPYGQVPMEKSLLEMELLSKNDSSHSSKELLHHYIANRFSSNLNMTSISINAADIYYIPQDVSEMFVAVMSIFLKHKVFFGIAVPTTIAGLHPTLEHMKGRLIGKSIWGNERNHPFKFFNVTSDFIHPLKLSSVFNDKIIREKYCQNYVQNLLKNW